ncbi:MAG: DUF3105 domain-containing protein [Chloroflexi bacterium]|nr:DUF3105 domain-containing protein [Chloroflexota bacterium]
MTRIRTRRLAAAAAALLAAALVLTACGGGSSIKDDPRLQQFDDEFTTAGQEHYPAGFQVTYVTTPPYGGPHWTIPLRCGIYEQEQPFEPMVHTMEHGAIVLYYQPLAVDADTVGEMRVAASQLLSEGRRMILTPSTRIGVPVAMASWGRLMLMDDFEADTLRAFLDAFEGDAPEELGC